MDGTFEDFLAALLAFESGWDRDRYNAGVIQDWQLDQWAGGPVESRFPQYSSWSELSDAEWEAMAYRSMNSLGFVGFQFGEALLIDLGYYDADSFYGNGAATNSWDGTWTGKNGVNSLEDFMTKDAQTVAIQEAFGYNLQVLQTQLAGSGQLLSDFIGDTASYTQNGQTVTVELTLTGILAAAHLRGAWGTATLLQNGVVSTDEYGTSILQYIDQFGGYASPSLAQIIAFYEDRLTGDEGLGTPAAPDEPGTPDAPDIPDTPAPPEAPDNWNGTAGVTATTATLVITWAWGTDRTVSDFNPQSDTIFIDWFGPEAIDVSEVSGNTVFTMASNNQTLTLEGIALVDLSPANFTIMSTATGQEILSRVGPGRDGPNPEDPVEPGMPGAPQMIMILPDSSSRVIENFDPVADMIHLETGVIAERLEFADYPMTIQDAPAGLTIRVLAPTGEIASETLLVGIDAAELSISNFMVAEESALNEVAALLGQTVSTPGSGGFAVVYDTDGSNPPVPSGASDLGGVKWAADFGADDIIGFNPAADEIDFGNASVHGLILTMTPDGEPVIDNPWGPDMQILQGVQLSELLVGNFGIVGNEHLRQDIGGILSWVRNAGPREKDTVYVRSHEYGASEVIDGFDPATQKISFLYFGTRERLRVEDSSEGMVISSLPSGQSFVFTGVSKADLIPGNVEFHHDQVMEDNLEAPFGFDQNDVTLVSRAALLTPQAPPGETTDGDQIRDGVGAGTEPDQPDLPGIPEPPETPDISVAPPVNDDDIVLNQGADTLLVTWDWGRKFVVKAFNPAEDVINFSHLSASDVLIEEVGRNLQITIENNGGHSYLLEGLKAEDLSAANLTAAGWNTVVTDFGGVADQLAVLGNADFD